MGIVSSKIGLAVVGYGYWGPNIVRNAIGRPEFDLRCLCELNDTRVSRFLQSHPDIPVEREFDRVLDDPSIQAVSIATPPNTHYSLVKRALEAGKHVLVEKPLATTIDHAAELRALGEDLGLVLMPGHTFLYSPPVNKVRDLIKDGTIGEPYFVTSSRMNLGIYQRDGVVRDLAPHDLSILLYWLDEPVTSVSVTGRSVFHPNVPETAFLTLTFASGASANVQISWLAPRKVRQMVVVGSKRMVQYEDTSADESVRVYDRGLELKEPTNYGEYRMTYRTGDMVAPRVEAQEPLGLELEDFANSILTGQEPRSNARLGEEIVHVLEAAEQSFNAGGAPVEVHVARRAEYEVAAVGEHTNGDAKNGNAIRPGRRFTRLAAEASIS